MKVKEYGLVVISREGSNPERFVAENEMLRKKIDESSSVWS